MSKKKVSIKTSDIKRNIEFLIDSTTMEGYCDKVCFNLMGDMVEYMGILLKNAREAQYEEKFGTDAMKLLLKTGLARRIKSCGEFYVQHCANLQQIEDILGNDPELEFAE